MYIYHSSQPHFVIMCFSVIAGIGSHICLHRTYFMGFGLVLTPFYTSCKCFPSHDVTWEFSPTGVYLCGHNYYWSLAILLCFHLPLWFQEEGGGVPSFILSGSPSVYLLVLDCPSDCFLHFHCPERDQAVSVFLKFTSVLMVLCS